MNDTDDKLFCVKDPRGKIVSLSKNRYYTHIISNDDQHQAHPEFTPNEIQQTIETPDVIYGSSFPDSDVYFKKGCIQYPSLFIKVAVSMYDNEETGEVSTAFLSRHISGNNDEGSLKYVKPRL